MNVVICNFALSKTCNTWLNMTGLGIKLMENLLLLWNRSHLVWMWGMSWASQMDWTWLEVLPA